MTSRLSYGANAGTSLALSRAIAGESIDGEDGDVVLNAVLCKERVVLFTNASAQCSRAREVLRARGISFEEVELYAREDGEGLKTCLRERAGRGKEVPYLFLDGKYVGGSETATELVVEVPRGS
ncbi:hypothetical protein BC830DRAFT_1143569 [Chytriomyces sp. MP71]|nr:hypothetical protein BC830DRAFT_1143569 [Chytriomyces sp. MP71]